MHAVIAEDEACAFVKELGSFFKRHLGQKLQGKLLQIILIALFRQTHHLLQSSEAIELPVFLGVALCLPHISPVRGLVTSTS
jgi:hypothetical protein